MDQKLKRRIKLLRDYLESISDNESMESIYTQLKSASSGEMGLELITISNEDHGLETLDAIYTQNDSVIDGAGLDNLEAIIHIKGRPVIDIIQDTYHIPTDQWSSVLGGDTKARINQTIRSVGRIEISNATIPYIGTGFVVGENILMTNRHVAWQFTSGLGQRDLVFDHSLQPGIDFKREVVPPSLRRSRSTQN